MGVLSVEMGGNQEEEEEAEKGSLSDFPPKQQNLTSTDNNNKHTHQMTSASHLLYPKQREFEVESGIQLKLKSNKIFMFLSSGEVETLMHYNI